jgi:hypothetical protein
MPAQGRQLLSSRLTFALQIGPMLLWLAVVYVLIWLGLHRFTGVNGLGGNGALPTFEKMVLFLLAVPFLLLPVVALWASGLRRVATDGSSLLVTLATGFRATIPLTDVSDVQEWHGIDLRTVTVTFERRTAAGRHLRFLAPTRFVIPRGEPHPVVLALRETVAAAKSAVGGAAEAGFAPDATFADTPATTPRHEAPALDGDRPTFGKRGQKP